MRTALSRNPKAIVKMKAKKKMKRTTKRKMFHPSIRMTRMRNPFTRINPNRKKKKKRKKSM